MGRETKILLALLGLLVGVFVGVVSLKLFVPRPPAGTGPDIDMASEPLPLVDPPALDPPAIPQDDAYARRSSRFMSSVPVETPPRQGRFIAPASFEPVVETGDAAGDHNSTTALPRSGIDMPARAIAQPPELISPPTAPPGIDQPSSPPAPFAREEHDAADPKAFAGTAPAHGPTPGTSYVTREGDSWWTLAEQAYGDGRLYRALYAWNRSLDARVSLVPGTRLDIPPTSKLSAAWSTLLPRD